MTLEEARSIRLKLISLEGLIASNTREYIWMVVIGPQDKAEMEGLTSSLEPARPMDSGTFLEDHLNGEWSVYFLLKKNGMITCKHFPDFLAANHLNTTAHSKKTPAFSLAGYLEKAGEILSKPGFNKM